MTRFAFASNDIYDLLKDVLKRDVELVLLGENRKCYKAVAKHPDIQMLVVDHHLFVDRSLEADRGSWVTRTNPQYLHILDSNLGPKYPNSVPFNGKIYNKTFIHNLKVTSPDVLKFLEERSYDTIQVNQGYTNCSLLMLPGRRGITADKGIYKKLLDSNYDILLIEEGHILLKGMDYGFIGGCCGMDDHKIYINGDLDSHPDGQRMRSYIMASEMEVIEVKNQPLFDIGSIVFWEAEDAG